ncbi:TetR/AcrR family transcriptional regulator [Paralimibaculum aggregatum]|uniref:TetR/AcrR family transcriptional regulator n=1 Tax=Paralimibaculum aggregatum TaxID=3036245 RepID=A0ABQ6LNP7_9RHOB|nr:TetR/AcrR family transcriptional regulator [Limibaculum sp. NKW23]GMG84844.1 TetR/AcrR family transcriptional regulator [Limibaculum sp. NKW23]
MKRARPYDRDTALDAAMLLFWRKGYHATSLKDLEAALAMKPGSIYAAFTSKEALYLAALERYFLRSRDGLRAVLGEAASPLAALAGYLRESAGRQPETGIHACMLVKTMLDTTAEGTAIGDRARDYLAAMRAEILAAFTEAQALGELPAEADPARLAQRYQANLTALRIEAQRGAGAEELAALADDMAGEVEALRRQAH